MVKKNDKNVKITNDKDTYISKTDNIFEEIGELNTIVQNNNININDNNDDIIKEIKDNNEEFAGFDTVKEVKTFVQTNINNNIDNIKTVKNNDNSNSINTVSTENKSNTTSINNKINNSKKIQISGLSDIIIEKNDSNKKEDEKDVEQEQSPIIKEENIEKKDNNEKKEEEINQSPIIKKDDDENKNTIDSVVFTSEIIKVVSEKDSSEIKENQNDNESKNIISEPGQSQNVIKDNNAGNSDNNNINEEEKNKINKEELNISVKDISVSNIKASNNDSLKQSNISKDEENKSEKVFNLLNTNLSENQNIDNIDSDNKNQISLSLVKNESSDTFSFRLLKSESNESNKNIELPNNIHIHPLNKYALSDNICSTCSKKKSCESGFKCDNCPLIICDECAQFINTNYNLHDKHEHPLVLLEKEMFKCNKCEKSDNLNNNFVFCCEECNFGICPNCYFTQNNN